MQQQQRHTIAAGAQSGFTDATSYDTHRPSYAHEAVQKLLSNLHVAGQTGARIVDLAAGTGKFTEVLVARPEGFDVVAVEPHVEMLRVLQGKQLRGVRTLEGSATDMTGVESGWADAVVVAQAFHWFANPAALREIHRVLKPGGHLGLIWNFYDSNARIDWAPHTPWEARLGALSRSLEDTPGSRRHDLWPAVFSTQHGLTPDDSSPTTTASTTSTTTHTKPDLFTTPLGTATHLWTTHHSKAQGWASLSTISHIASLDRATFESTRLQALEIMSSDPSVRRNAAGEVEAHGRTVVYWTAAICR